MSFRQLTLPNGLSIAKCRLAQGGENMPRMSPCALNLPVAATDAAIIAQSRLSQSEHCRIVGKTGAQTARALADRRRGAEPRAPAGG